MINMEPLIIKATERTPYINFDAEKGILEMEGRSIGTDMRAFFQPVFEWIDEYVASPRERTQLVCKLIYFNTSSSKVLFHIFKTFEKITVPNLVEIQWHCEEDDEYMLECGEDFQRVLRNINFRIFDDL